LKLEQTRDQLGLADSVELLGYQKNLEGFFKSIDIYVQPSLSESFGLSLFEAMPYGKPIVASRVGNIPHVLQDRYGIAVPLDGYYRDKFVTALEIACSDHESLGAAALEGFLHWQRQLSAASMRQQYIAIYRELLRPGICMLAPLVTHAKGGLQQQLFLQSRELTERGYRIFILQNQDVEENHQKPEWNHVEFLSVPQPFGKALKNNIILSRIRGMIYIAGGFWHLFRQNRNIRLYHAHQLYSPTLLGVFGKILFRKPLVVKVTASGTLGELAQLKQLPFFEIRKRAFKKIDRVFALTDEMREEALELGIAPEKVLVLPNSVKMPEFRLQGHGFVENERKLLFVGRLSFEKSIDTLLKAANILAMRGHSVTVDILGAAYKSRDASEDLKSLAASFTSGVKVIFHGERKDVPIFYQGHPIFVLPSESEGMSNALLEAMANGLTCVVSDIPANTFLVKNCENGITFKQGNAEDLAAKIEELWRDQEQSGALSALLSSNARKTIEEKFSTQVIGKRISEVYEELWHRPIKVLRLFSRLNIGGPALHVVNLSFGLTKSGYETKLIVGSLSPGEGDMSYYAKKKGVEPIVVPEFQAPIHPVKDAIAFLKILKIMWSVKPDIVHTHTFKAGLLGRLAAVLLKVPYRVHTYHGHLLEGYGSNRKTKIILETEKLLGGFTDQVITVSQLVAQDLVKHQVVPAEKMNVVELGFDIDPFLREAEQPSTLKGKLGLTEDHVVVGLAGRLVPIKSVDLFLKAVNPLFKEFPSLHVVIIGDGEERNALQSLASEYKSRIHFMGWMSPLHPELKDLDLLVCSSKNEGTSVSVIEAILCGVPVISTRVGGMSDLLHEGRWGDLVDYDETELRDVLKKRIRTLCQKKSLEYFQLQKRSVSAAKEFYKRFHLNRLLEDIRQIYSKGLGDFSGPKKLSRSKKLNVSSTVLESSPTKMREPENLLPL
jgi:glycosyltransferase involved in cell wall biosynthesis